MEKRELGRRLQQLRRRKKLSLRALSRSTHVAVSFLSALEQGTTNISVAKLKTILDALGTGLSEFFSQNSHQPKVVYRNSELVEIAGYGTGISYREVAVGRPGRALQFTVERYKPGAQTGPEPLQYDAEEAGVVLKGKLQLSVDNEVCVLGPGDAYYIDNNRPHRFRNIGRGVLLVVSANTPTTF
jgi:mannose-6-phosphate isomerase-like protein (cupin superfamily)